MAEEIIIDAEKAVLGRLAGYAAKQALLGKEVVIVNAEKAVIVGNEKDIIERYKKKRARGGYGLRGPNFPSTPERILKRAIRGMLSYKQERGREAYKRVKCFIGVPEEFKNKKVIKGKGKKGMSLKKLSKMLRGEK